MADINKIPEVLLQRVVDKILDDIAHPQPVNALGELCLDAYISGGPAVVYDNIDEVCNYDGPDDWSIEDCAAWLYDKDLLDECSEWQAAIADPYGHVSWRDDELAAAILARLRELAQEFDLTVVGVEGLDEEGWATLIWEAMPDNARAIIERVLREEVALWAEDEDVWRQAVADNWEYPEVYQWFAMDDRFIRALKEQGEVTMSAFDLDMWGRQGCGSDICTDYAIQQAAAVWWPYYVDEFPKLKEYING